MIGFCSVPAPTVRPPKAQRTFTPAQDEADLGRLMAEQAKRDQKAIRDRGVMDQLNIMSGNVTAQVKARHDKILAAIRDLGECTSHDIANHPKCNGIDVKQIQRDLTRLVGQGVLGRDHAKAFAKHWVAE